MTPQFTISQVVLNLVMVVFIVVELLCLINNNLVGKIQFYIKFNSNLSLGLTWVLTLNRLRTTGLWYVMS